ncbi:uncharacterized protein LOC131207561 [Anopheles bellator]|uniref:uncharacterized protein LOC131207561 n=1 Tax=Anopheles bellator TaxID=139047 RepID=UPI00264804AD|nr:uncharacterized protein LOC131207561 [Anopheles bellator]
MSAKRRGTANNGQPGPSSSRRPLQFQAGYNDYHSDSDCEELNALPLPATAFDYEWLVDLYSQIEEVCERSPMQSPSATFAQMICVLEQMIPGLPRDPRAVLKMPWNITLQDVTGLPMPASFWQRDVKEAIARQTARPSTVLDLFVDGAPFKQLSNPKMLSWVVPGRVRDMDTGPPGKPFGLTVFCGSRAPTAQMLLGPLCQQLEPMTHVTPRAVLSDAEGRARAKANTLTPREPTLNLWVTSTTAHIVLVFARK